MSTTTAPLPSLSDLSGKELSGVRTGLSRGERLLLCLATAALLLTYNWLAHVWLDMIDEGYFMEQATRIMRGLLPYRDFDTYYTPAAIYLHALTFWITGQESIIPVRLILAVVKTLTALMLYLLARPLAPPAIAAIPVLIVLSIDPVPIMWEPHPGTYANLAMLAVLAAMAHYLERRRPWSLVAAGLAAGIAFAFKQNIGVFSVMSVSAFLVLYQRPVGLGWIGPVGRLGAALALPLAFTALLWRVLDELYLVIFLLPLYAICAIVLLRSFSFGAVEVHWRDLVKQLALFLIPFGVLTVVWIVPLALALGWREVPWGLFIGRVNKAALVFALDPPAPAFRWAVLLTAAPLVGFALLRPFGRRAVLCLIGLTIAGGVASLVTTRAPHTFPPDYLVIPELYVLSEITARVGNLALYLPSILFWATLATLAVSNGRITGGIGARWWWYLFAGGVFMFAQYPRVDEIHLLHAAPPIFLAAAGLAAAAWRAAPTWSLARALVLATIVLLPAISVSSTIGWRTVTVLVPDIGRPTVRQYDWLANERAPVTLPDHAKTSYEGVVAYIRERTGEHEPIFVFPVAPMFYFLTDRPNPTRYNHLQPGVADADEQERIIRDLANVRFIVWDHLGVLEWGTTIPYTPLTEHIWWCFTPMEDFPPYVVLQRNVRCA